MFANILKCSRYLKKGGWFSEHVLEIWKKGVIFYFCERWSTGMICLFSIWLKKGCVNLAKVYLKYLRKGVLFWAKLYPFLCEIGIKISWSVLETGQKRGAILSCGTIMRYTFKYKVITPGDFLYRSVFYCRQQKVRIVSSLIIQLA